MTLLEQVKQGAFLAASCNLSLPFDAGEWILESGVHCKLYSRGVLQITPKQLEPDAKDIVLSSGVHGNETAPIELIQQLAEGMLLGHIQPVHRVLLIIAHPEAINKSSRFVDENMNRLFQVRNPERNKECIVANQLQQAIDSFYGTSTVIKPERWHLDLHCAIRDSEHHTFAVSPYTDKPSRGENLFSFLAFAKIEAVVLSDSASPTFSWYSAEYHGAQALTIELGKVAKFGENDLSRLTYFNRALLQLVTKSILPAKWNNEVTVYRVSRTLTKQSEHFSFSFPDELANFTFFEAGVLLGGDENGKIYAFEGGEAVVFPNANVAIGQRAALMVQKTKLILDSQVRTIDEP